MNNLKAGAALLLLLLHATACAPQSYGGISSRSVIWGSPTGERVLLVTPDPDREAYLASLLAERGFAVLPRHDRPDPSDLDAFALSVIVLDSSVGQPEALCARKPVVLIMPNFSRLGIVPGSECGIPLHEPVSQEAFDGALRAAGWECRITGPQDSRATKQGKQFQERPKLSPRICRRHMARVRS